MLVDDQIPITAAPSDAKTSDSPPAPARNMKNATVAKKSGQRTPSRPSKDDRVIIFRWSPKPTASVRAMRGGNEPCPSESDGGSAIDGDGLLGDERHVGVLERRLAGRHAAEGDAVEAAEDLVRQLVPDVGLDDDDLRLVALLDGDRRDALDRAEPLDLPVLDPVDLDLDDDALRRRAP